METNDKYKKVFSKNLNYYMKLHGKTQTDIITDLHINKSAISSWCNGTRLPRMNKVQLLANYLNIEVSDLIQENYENNNYFEFVVEDDSMFPLLDVGDIALIYKQNTIDSTPPSTNNAGTYLININGHKTIRRFIESPNKDYYTLEGMNIACKPTTVKKEELNVLVNIIGKVVKAENKSAFKQ